MHRSKPDKERLRELHHWRTVWGSLELLVATAS
jgi:hypothetical protein